MKKSILLVFALFQTAICAQAAEIIVCSYVHPKSGSLQTHRYEINGNRILQSKYGIERETEIWNISEPTMFYGNDSSYFAISEGSPKGNEKNVEMLMLDIDPPKSKITDKPRGQKFKMKMAEVWESLYFDSTSVIEDIEYTDCKRL